MHCDFRVRIAAPSDATQLGLIGPAIYAETYGHMWNDGAKYARFLESFGPQAMSELLKRSDTFVWIVEQQSRLVGFLTMILGSPDPIDGRNDGAEISRIYLLGPARGKGIGKVMLGKASEFARRQGVGYLWLDAMEKAYWARETYLKWGFEPIGITRFDQGIMREYQKMIVLKRDVTA